MSRTLQDVIDELRGNDLPYGELIVEALQIIANELEQKNKPVVER